ncbi:MAG: HK97 family phage prohead protease, partial [Actinomycetota bacterium]|nr:HK97 family phage prohead protease [Actinomycetota bacterium]
TVTEADLFDVSLVTYPAYPETSVGVRSALMDHGFDAEAIVRCIERRRLGRDVLPDDQPVLRQALDIIEALIGDVEEHEDDAPDEAPGLRMTANHGQLLAAAMRAVK